MKVKDRSKDGASQDNNVKEKGQPVVVTSLGVLALHFAWLLLGPMVLLILLLGIAQAGGGWFTGRDAAFVGFLVATILARWGDQWSGQGTTVSGETSTWREFHRYLLIFPPLAICGWFVANALGNHLLGGAGS